MYATANISSCGRYRYDLSRTWDTAKPAVLFVGLNPSTANESIDDPTIRRLIGYAQQWGYGRLLVGNLFALRSPTPTSLFSAPNPVGNPANDAALLRLTGQAELIVAAWGNDGVYLNRSHDVQDLLKSYPLHCLKKNKSGEPSHPLYLKKILRPIPFP